MPGGVEFGLTYVEVAKSGMPAAVYDFGSATHFWLLLVLVSADRDNNRCRLADDSMIHTKFLR